MSGETKGFDISLIWLRVSIGSRFCDYVILLSRGGYYEDNSALFFIILGETDDSTAYVSGG